MVQSPFHSRDGAKFSGINDLSTFAGDAENFHHLLLRNLLLLLIFLSLNYKQHRGLQLAILCVGRLDTFSSNKRLYFLF